MTRPRTIRADGIAHRPRTGPVANSTAYLHRWSVECRGQRHHRSVPPRRSRVILPGDAPIEK